MEAMSASIGTTSNPKTSQLFSSSQELLVQCGAHGHVVFHVWIWIAIWIFGPHLKFICYWPKLMSLFVLLLQVAVMRTTFVTSSRTWLALDTGRPTKYVLCLAQYLFALASETRLWYTAYCCLHCIVSWHNQEYMIERRKCQTHRQVTRTKSKSGAVVKHQRTFLKSTSNVKELFKSNAAPLYRSLVTSLTQYTAMQMCCR